MDNPAAVLTDDVEDWSPPTGSNQSQTQFRLNDGSDGTYSTNIPNNSPQTQSPTPHQKQEFQQPTIQQHYKRNASTYSIDIPATLGLMVTNNNPAANGGSTTSST